MSAALQPSSKQGTPAMSQGYQLTGFKPSTHTPGSSINKRVCYVSDTCWRSRCSGLSRHKWSCFPAISASSCGCPWPQSRLFSKGQEMHLEWKNGWIVFLPPTKLDQVTRACIGERSPRPTSRTSSEGLLTKH